MKMFSWRGIRHCFFTFMAVVLIFSMTSCEPKESDEIHITINYPIGNEQIFEAEFVKNGVLMKSVIMPEMYYPYFFNESIAYGGENKIAVVLNEEGEYFLVYSNDWQTWHRTKAIPLYAALDKVTSCRLSFPSSDIGYLAFAYQSEYVGTDDSGMTNIYQTKDGGETWELLYEIGDSSLTYFRMGENGNGFLNFENARYEIADGSVCRADS